MIYLNKFLISVQETIKFLDNFIRALDCLRLNDKES